MGKGSKKSYQDECMAMRMHLVELLARPSFGHRTWVDTIRIGDALIELDRQADSMDKEAFTGIYTEKLINDEDECAPRSPDVEHTNQENKP